jgi:hypothetical protein
VSCRIAPAGYVRVWTARCGRKVESRNVSRSARGLGPLRIAQIAPLFESVPPRLYGGTERVVAYLCQELKRRGHQVTLFASGDSTIDVPLKPGCPNSLRTSNLDRFGAAYHLSMLSELCESAQDFDIYYSHIDYWSFPLELSIPAHAANANRFDHAQSHGPGGTRFGLPLL